LGGGGGQLRRRGRKRRDRGAYWNIKEMAHASQKVLVIAEQIVPVAFTTCDPK
jgi:hypothetical protein